MTRSHTHRSTAWPLSEARTLTSHRIGWYVARMQTILEPNCPPPPALAFQSVLLRSRIRLCAHCWRFGLRCAAGCERRREIEPRLVTSLVREVHPRISTRRKWPDRPKLCAIAFHADHAKSIVHTGDLTYDELSHLRFCYVDTFFCFCSEECLVSTLK